MKSSTPKSAKRPKALRKIDAVHPADLGGEADVSTHCQSMEEVDPLTDAAAAEREDYLATIEACAKEQFITLADLKRLMRVQTLKSAKEYESPEAKLRRFVEYLQFELAVQYDAPYGADWPKRGGYKYALGVQYLLRHVQNDKTLIIEDLNNGSPGEFLNRMESLQRAGLNEYYIPRAWLPALKAEWAAWVKRDTAKKRERESRGRGRDFTSGQFKPARNKQDGTFTNAHPNIFRKT